MEKPAQEFLEIAIGGQSGIGDTNAVLSRLRVQDDQVVLEVDRIAFDRMAHC